MTHYRIHTKEFVVGAVVGSLLGSIAALLAAPKSGKNLCQDICDAYCDASEKTQNLAKKGSSLAKSMGCQTCDWTSKAKSTVEGVGKSVKEWISGEEQIEEHEGTRDLLIGGLAGGLLGAVVGLLLAPKSGERLRQDIVDNYEDVSEKAERLAKKGKSFARTASSRADKWLNFAKHFVEELTENAQDTGEDWVEKAKELVHNDRLSEIMDWAALGFRVWQGIKSKR